MRLEKERVYGVLVNTSIEIHFVLILSMQGVQVEVPAIFI